MSKYILENNIDIEPLISTRDFLTEALEKADNKFEIAGTIQAFEVCYELTWKTLKKVLNYYGIKTLNPREVFRSVAEQKLIDDLKGWFDYLKKRNITV